ncbi:hypothetical protein DH2020_000068 [Rehmannia glutinosa]|uniref:RING-type E3 ubiquitin transferase n=1 Tax=Rehmannia glutinosa TaxID=99300 RepID=A0ABR0XVJ5_REHGL
MLPLLGGLVIWREIQDTERVRNTADGEERNKSGLTRTSSGSNSFGRGREQRGRVKGNEQMEGGDLPSIKPKTEDDTRKVELPYFASMIQKEIAKYLSSQAAAHPGDIHNFSHFADYSGNTYNTHFALSLLHVLGKDNWILELADIFVHLRTNDMEENTTHKDEICAPTDPPVIQPLGRGHRLIIGRNHRNGGGFPAVGEFSRAGGWGGDAVHVAVGKSVEKTAALLRWSISMFSGKEIVLLHVHRPSPLIPTLLGKLPASQANPAMVAAFRNEEREETMKMLSTYLMTCSRSRVKASILTTESDEVQKGIVNLVNRHGIRKLVVGAIPEILTLTWNENCLQAEASQTEITSSTISRCVKSTCDPLYSQSASSSTNVSSGNEYATSVEPRVSSVSSSKTVEECLCIRLAELKGEVDESRDEAYLKLIEPKKLEDVALETFNKVKALEMAHSDEVKLRVDAEDALRITIQTQQKILEERQKITQQLQMTMRNIALLDSRAHEANRRCEEIAGELNLIQASIATLRKEKQKLQGQKIEATRWLDRWRNHEQCDDDANESRVIGLMGDSCRLPELLFSDLEVATCNFSESFRIGQGGCGIVYKGEMLGKTVAIKKLHSYSMQRQTEFHKAVQVLGKLHHPRLVELIGVCPESSSLVYEYLPGGSLKNHLCNKDISVLNWKIRARIVADIASALLFLHSFTSKKIVHGNLKPENLLLDSQNRCKISDYGDNMLIASQTFRCPSFRRCSASSGVCLYTDPESHRTGALTYKSDIYSFGVIVLQLVTGKTHGGLVGEVRRALSVGKVASVWDLSAGDWSTYVARRLVELGLQCCELNGRDRPELTPSLVKELERMPYLEEQTVPSFFLCPILREIMHDPQVAADGFTYEGDALRGWLESGRETSPMTNLRLSHSNLVPNHSLRLAIQDWLANLEIAS